MASVFDNREVFSLEMCPLVLLELMKLHHSLIHHLLSLLFSASCIRYVEILLIYRIAGNFRGPYISRIAIKFIFAETNFVDCMIKATPTRVLLAAVGWL